MGCERETDGDGHEILHAVRLDVIQRRGKRAILPSAKYFDPRSARRSY